MKYVIEVDTDHPLADQAVVNHAQTLSHELGLDGHGHSYLVRVVSEGTELAAFAEGQ